MNRLWAGVAGLLLVVVRGATAQEPTEVKFEDLRVPASPAFVLMGIEPKTIERPRTPRAFGLSVIQATNELSGLPKNYAMEFAPFWLVPHPNLEFRPDRTESLGATIIQTLSLSLATATDSAAAQGSGNTAPTAVGPPPTCPRLEADPASGARAGGDLVLATFRRRRIRTGPICSLASLESMP